MTDPKKSGVEDLVPLGLRRLFQDVALVRAAFELADTLGESREQALVRVINALHEELLKQSAVHGAAGADKSEVPSRPDRHEQDARETVPMRSVAARRGLPVHDVPALHSAPNSPPPLETLRTTDGRIVMGWAGEGVLFASFHGHLSVELGELYAARLEALLCARSGVRYFIDSSELESFELAAGNMAVRALVAAEPVFVSVLVLRWLGGESASVRAALQPLAALLSTTDVRAEFMQALTSAAGSPSAEEQVATSRPALEL